MTATVERGNDALIIVDVQYDFVEGGALAVSGGNDAARRISEYVKNLPEHYGSIITTQDWHIDPKGHFADDPDFIDTWPKHCVAGERGAEILPNIREALVESDRAINIASVHKGLFTAAYSGFEGFTDDGATLESILHSLNPPRIFVCGIATDYCVRETCLDGARLGFETFLIPELSVGINPDRIEKTFKDMKQAGVEIHHV